MAKFTQFDIFLPKKHDGIVEAVHYKGGKIAWVRAYERRGPTWSDHVLLDRETLIERLENKKKFFVGQRIIYNASEFEIGERIVLQKTDKGPIVTLKGTQANKDTLDGVPVI